MPKNGISTLLDDFNRSADKKIKVQEKSCKIYALENSNDKVGINRCNQNVTYIKKRKGVINLKMDIIDLLSSPNFLFICLVARPKADLLSEYLCPPKVGIVIIQSAELPIVILFSPEESLITNLPQLKLHPLSIIISRSKSSPFKIRLILSKSSPPR